MNHSKQIKYIAPCLMLTIVLIASGCTSTSSSSSSETTLTVEQQEVLSLQKVTKLSNGG